MRSIGHWTPRYMFDRVVDKLYSRAHPDDPWLTPQAIGILTTMLLPTADGLEFGSGRSTCWLAQRVRHLTSVEHDQDWFADVSLALKERELQNVDYVFAPRDVPADRGAESEYVGVTSRFAVASLDFVLVDGAYRDFCALAAIPKIKSGGLLIIDNVNWCLPSESRSPASRSPAAGPDGPVWSRVWETVRPWRSIWTSSGVWDTAIFIKP
jgi:hypothetical protein